MPNFLKVSSIGAVATSALLTAQSIAFASSNALGQVTNQTGYAESIGSLISSVLSIVITLALVLVLIYLIWGGISWITAGGDKGKTEEARNKITAAVIGIIILAAAYALVQFTAYILGFKNLNDALSSVKQINTTTK